MTNYIMRLHINLLLALCFLFSQVSAQTPKSRYSSVDSLIQKSSTYSQANSDSAQYLIDKAIALAQESKSAESLQRVYQQIGYIYYNKNLFEKASKYFNLSYQVALELNDLNGQALALNRLGNVCQLQTSYLTALDYYLKALELNTRGNNQAEVARTLVNLANVYSIIGQYQRSIEHFLKAMDIHEEVGEREGLAWASLGIARLFKRLDLLDKAMQYAQSALDHYRYIEQQTGNAVGVTLSLNEIGSIYHKLGNFNKALEYTRMVLEINEKTGNALGQAANYISLGVIFLEQGNDELARKYLNKALSLKSSVGDSLDLASLYRHLGTVEIKSNNPKLAHRYFTQSLTFAQQHRLIPDIGEAYLSLASIYSQLGNHTKALEAYKNHSAYKDSLNSSDIARLEMQYEFEKREKEQELLTRQREALQKARLDRQRVVLLFFVVAFLLTGILTAFIFYAYREKKRINLLLVEQKKEIENQKEEIEQQRDFVTRQRDQIAEQQKQITDSITYASRIQNAVLPGEITLAQLPWESFVFYKPKNIVSGDFYWISKLSNGKILIAAADCTGHGVPGAFMSMLGITLLREITSRNENLQPADILMRMREMVILSLNPESDRIDQHDGMDMSITIIDTKSLVMEYAGAYQSVVVVREGVFNSPNNTDLYKLVQRNNISLLEIKGDKMPIGYHVLQNESFHNQTITLQKGDMLYLYSDGYADQFGGPRGIKFLTQNLRELLISIYSLSIIHQKETISSTIEDYQGNQKQVDDMLVMGVKIR